MKRIILFFFIVSFGLKANYLITNGEIALFYDNKNNILENLKSYNKKEESISNLQIILLHNYKFYKMNEYHFKVEFDGGRNIFFMTNFVDDMKIKTYIIPSMFNKKNLYIFVDLKDIKWNNYKLIYRFVPLKKVGYLNEFDNYYNYGTLKFSRSEKSKVLVGTEKNFNNFEIKLLDKKIRKLTEENIYLVENMTDKDKYNFIQIGLDSDRFNMNYKNEKSVDILNRELLLWHNFDRKYSYLKREIVTQIKNFYIVSNGSDLKTDGRKKENVKFIQKILNKKSLLSEYHFDNFDANINIYEYFYYIKLKKIRGEAIDLKRLNGGLSRLEKNITTSYKNLMQENINLLDDELIFIKTIDELKNMNITTELRKKIDLMRIKVKENMKKHILNEYGGLKQNKYVSYINALEKNEGLKIIQKLLGNIDNSIGVLRDENGIDVVSNLNFAIILYENGFKESSDKIFYKMVGYINENENEDRLELSQLIPYLLNVYYRGLI